MRFGIVFMAVKRRKKIKKPKCQVGDKVRLNNTPGWQEVKSRHY